MSRANARKSSGAGIYFPAPGVFLWVGVLASPYRGLSSSVWLKDVVFATLGFQDPLGLLSEEIF